MNGAADSANGAVGIPLPDLGERLLETCRRNGWQFETLESENVNDAPIAAWLREERPRLVIYSGYGGQLVGDELLGLGVPFLHMHAGWLPDFRGSTTVYYSLLKERNSGVSAILLERNIDEGPIVGRRHYPPPPRGADVDYAYDGAMRADLLVSVLGDWLERGEFAEAQGQNPDEGEIYYVIHPVLKHLSIMSLERGGAE